MVCFPFLRQLLSFLLVELDWQLLTLLQHIRSNNLDCFEVNETLPHFDVAEEVASLTAC